MADIRVFIGGIIALSINIDEEVHDISNEGR